MATHQKPPSLPRRGAQDRADPALAPKKKPSPRGRSKAPAVSPQVEMEVHDTELDAPRSPRPSRKVIIHRKEPEPPAERRELAPRRPVLAGDPIGEEEQLRSGALAKLRVREALVKVQRSIADEKAAEREEKVAPPRPPPTTVPDVRIAWLRTTDRSQSIIRYGADGFVLRGTADGQAARRAGAPRPSVAIGVDGLIFSVPLRAGDSASDVADRLAARLGASYEVEVLERRPELAIVRLLQAR